MPQLVPSILETTKEGFLAMYSQESKLPGVERIQIDFGDGVFVPNKMLPVTEIDVLNPAMHFEAHLMCRAPKDFLDYKICGFQTIVIHYEAYDSGADLAAAIAAIRKEGMEPALALKLQTPVSVVSAFADRIKHFQLMSIEPGFQGTAFQEVSYGRIADLRKLCPNAIIEVDGGIQETNIKKVAAAGADYIILGSAITKAPDMLLAFEKLQAEILK